jgi:hypothetical protein
VDILGKISNKIILSKAVKDKKKKSLKMVWPCAMKIDYIYRKV